jgi:hypothetical protein
MQGDANERICLFCRWWDAPPAAHARAVEVTLNGGMSIRKPETFPCRRLPPQPDPRRPAFGEAQRANWAMTFPTEWCGEWSRKKDNAPDAAASPETDANLMIAAE